MPSRISDKKISIPEIRAIRKTMDDIFASPHLQGTVARLIRQSNRPDTDDFCRYAGITLREACGLDFASIPISKSLRILPPEDGRLSRIVSASALSDDEKAIVESVENAINRLACLVDAVEDGFVSGELGRQEVRIGYSLFGGAYLPNVPGYRSAHIELPEFEPHINSRIPYFNEVDWRGLDCVAAPSHLMFQHSIVPNVHQAVLGAYAAIGSDWDVRTRLAGILENMELPFRLDYRFDCNVAEHVAAVVFGMPEPNAMPAYVVDRESGGLEPTGPLLHDAVLSYAIRISCMIAAACFGSGRIVEHALVVGEDGNGNQHIRCQFDRDAFVFETLTALDSDVISNPRFRFDPSALRDVVGNRIFFPLEFDTARSIEAMQLFDALAANRIEPWKDDRRLSEELVELFRARTVSDIDCTHYFGSQSESIEEAKLDARDSVISAIARLEGVIDEIEEKIDVVKHDPNDRPLHCSNSYARLVVSLVEDATSIGLHAESYLRGNLDGSIDDSERQMYVRAPSALYHAHMGLSDLYERIGDTAGAEAESDKCITLAPTTVDAHFRKSYLLAQRGKLVEAANVILSALPYAVSDNDCSTLYYHLGLLLWSLDRKRDAAAVFTYTASKRGNYSDKASKIVAGLKRKGSEFVVAHASPLAAAREMKRARIPISPNDTAMTLIARAILGLSAINAPAAAAPYTPLLVRYYKGDKVVASACNSIRWGITTPDEGTRNAFSSTHERTVNRD